MACSPQKGLHYFNKFLCEEYLKDKRFVVTGCSNWNDYNTKEHLGTRVEVVISHDATAYPTKDGNTISNRFARLDFKVPKDITIPANSEVRPVNPVGTVYGKFRNELSVKCDDVEIINRQPKQ